MFSKLPRLLAVAFVAVIASSVSALAQLGHRFPSERKVVIDPVTGTPLTFLTSTPAGDSKIYPTHPQWTADGKWVIFRSNRVKNQAMAVNEETGDIVQVTETGYQGALCVGQKSMRLFFTRPENHASPDAYGGKPGERPRVPMQVVAIDLARVFADSAAGKMQVAAAYEQVFGTIPADVGGGGELAIDATEKVAYFRLMKEAAAKVISAEAIVPKILSKLGK